MINKALSTEKLCLSLCVFFHSGSLKLDTQAEAVIVPVAIDGSYDVFEKNNRVVGAAARVAFLKPIDTASVPLEDRKQILCDRIYSAIKEELGG